jgi:hypothetical protein
MRRCEQCHKPFERNHKKQRYCDSKCRRLAWAERQKELEKGTESEQPEVDQPEVVSGAAGLLLDGARA